MTNNAHEPRSEVRAFESVSGDTMGRLADVWFEWSG